jgi:hypothetical protein
VVPTDRVGRGAERSPVTRRRRVGAPDEAAEFVGCPGDSGPGGKEKGKFMSQTFEGTTIAVTGDGAVDPLDRGSRRSPGAAQNPREHQSLPFTAEAMFY